MVSIVLYIISVSTVSSACNHCLLNHVVESNTYTGIMEFNLCNKASYSRGSITINISKYKIRIAQLFSSSLTLLEDRICSLIK